jgi:hypothetical protein
VRHSGAKVLDVEIERLRVNDFGLSIMISGFMGKMPVIHIFLRPGITASKLTPVCAFLPNFGPRKHLSSTAANALTHLQANQNFYAAFFLVRQV